MGFIRLNKNLNELKKVLLDYTFILDYMPFAPEDCTKVYLTGLAFSTTDDNELEGLSIKLNMDKSTVLDAFHYWQTEGLVNISENPLSIEYMPVLPPEKRVDKKYSKTKYKAFNDQLHALIKDRPIGINEYREYYDLMDSTGLEVEAMLIIIAYCIRLKGEKITSPYILKVARDLTNNGYRTFDRVSERLSEFDLADKDLVSILSALNLTRHPDQTDKQLFVKWKKEYGFPLEVIIGAAKRTAGKKSDKGSMKELDSFLTRYYENRILTLADIDAYESERSASRALVSDLAKILDTWVERYDTVIEAYIAPWKDLGFAEEALKKIAQYCRLANNKHQRSFENMDSHVRGFYKKSIVSAESVQAFIHEYLINDEKIQTVLERLKIPSGTDHFARECYKTWTRDWGFDTDIILYSAELACGTQNPMRYMNFLLSAWKDKAIRTIAEAKAQNQTAANPARPANDTVIAREGNPNFVSRTLTSEQLNAMFKKLEDEDL